MMLCEGEDLGTMTRLRRQCISSEAQPKAYFFNFFFSDRIKKLEQCCEKGGSYCASFVLLDQSALDG